MIITIVAALFVLPLLDTAELTSKEIYFNQRVICYFAKNGKYPQVVRENATYYDGLDFWRKNDTELMTLCQLTFIKRPGNNRIKNDTSLVEELFIEITEPAPETITITPEPESTPKPEAELTAEPETLPNPLIIPLPPFPEPTAETFIYTKEFTLPREINPYMYEDIQCYGPHVDECRDEVVHGINIFSESLQGTYAQMKDFWHRLFNNTNYKLE